LILSASREYGARVIKRIITRSDVEAVAGVDGII
jgi:hypothetical protein